MEVVVEVVEVVDDVEVGEEVEVVKVIEVVVAGCGEFVVEKVWEVCGMVV